MTSGQPDPAYPVVLPRPRAPLTRAQRHAARLAGGFGVPVLMIGLSLLAAVVWAAVFLVVVVVVASADAFAGVVDLQSVRGAAPWLVVGLIGGIAVGVAAVVGGIMVSRRILRRAGHARPWGITFATSGIAVVAVLLVAWMAGTVLQVIADAVTPDDRSVAIAVVLAVVATVGGLALSATAGALTSWWMSDLMRGQGST